MFSLSIVTQKYVTSLDKAYFIKVCIKILAVFVLTYLLASLLQIIFTFIFLFLNTTLSGLKLAAKNVIS